jgi:hypothetical protein
MKNKNNIFVRFWRAITCADYVENYAEIKAKAESEAESVVVARDDDDNPMQMLSPADEDVTRVLGSGHFIWRLADDWPLDLIDGENKPKMALKSEARAFMFHVSTWAAVTGRKQRNLCVSIRTFRDRGFNLIHNGILLLPEGEEYDAFQIWWKDYVERFSLQYLSNSLTVDHRGNATLVDIFPEIPDSYTIEGTTFNHEGMEYMPKLEFWNPSNNLFNQWCWIVENCKGNVWVTNKQFIFENASDAVLFKLVNPEDKLEE